MKRAIALLLALFIFGVCPILALCSGCYPSQFPKEETRAAIVLAAEAVRAADGTCADLAWAKKNQTLALTCAAAYDTARNSLEASEAALDAGQATNMACMLKDGLLALERIVSAIWSAGGEIPPVVRDALRFAEPFAAGCHA